MAVLVTRPAPDNAATATALRARGFDALLAPMLRFEPVHSLDDDGTYGGAIVTSANALRAIADRRWTTRLRAAPLFAVGAHTAEVARAIGFGQVHSADGDAAALLDLVAAKTPPKAAPLVYLAGGDTSRDLVAALAARGITAVERVVYRMAAVRELPDEVASAFAAGGIAAVLHYSRRSAAAFVAAARASGLEITALALPQCCLSVAVAEVLRDAGATGVAASTTPSEAVLLDTLSRMLGQGQP